MNVACAAGQNETQRHVRLIISIGPHKPQPHYRHAPAEAPTIIIPAKYCKGVGPSVVVADVFVREGGVMPAAAEDSLSS